MNIEKKSARIERAKQHAAADRLRSGFYTDAKNHSIGCSVGCDAIDIAGWQGEYSNPHAIVAQHDGTPEWLEHLRDRIFEGLPPNRRSWWHVALAEALPVGSDMQAEYHLICIAILERQKTRSSNWDMAAYGDEVVAALDQTIAYHRNPTDSAAKSAADSAAESAADSVRSARSAAESAAKSARSAEYEWIADAVIGVFQSRQTTPEPPTE